MADIKKFTGYVAQDGSTHNSLKAATDHARDLKIKAALEDFNLVTNAANAGVVEDERGNAVIYAGDLPAFLFAHKADILAAFNQDVLTRKKREAKPKKKHNTRQPAKQARHH